MWLIPYSTLTFSSQHEADELIVWMKEKTAPWLPISFLSGEKKPYFSSFLGHRFTLKENAFPFLFPCILSGGITAFGFDTRIIVSVKPGWFMLVCIAALFIWFALNTYELYFVISRGFESPNWIGLVVPVILYALILFAFRVKVMRHKHKLETLFKITHQA